MNLISSHLRLPSARSSCRGPARARSIDAQNLAICIHSPAEKLQLEPDITNRCNKYTMRAEYMHGVLSEIFNYVNWKKENFSPEKCELMRIRFDEWSVTLLSVELCQIRMYDMRLRSTIAYEIGCFIANIILIAQRSR